MSKMQLLSEKLSKEVGSKTRLFVLIVVGYLVQFFLYRLFHAPLTNLAVSLCGPQCEIEGIYYLGLAILAGYFLSGSIVVTLMFILERKFIKAVSSSRLLFILLVSLYFFLAFFILA